MTRSPFFRRVPGWLVLAAACVVLAAPAAAAEEKRPNVILVLIDDQGYGDLSCHGNPALKTPAMDALWSQAVRLANFHVSPLCSPTRAALLTGRHCRKVGVQGTNGTEQHLATEAVTMADLFAANGYATGIFGKWHLGDRWPLRPMDRGFAESVVFPDGAVTTIPDHWGNRYFDDTYLHNGVPQRYPGYSTDVWFDLALRFIEANKDRPFFCYLPTNAAHAPYLAPEAYLAPYRKDPRLPAGFYGMIAKVDERLGGLRRRLAALGIERRTILIFLGDNGTAAGHFNAGMRGKKGSPYDGGHRVACFVHYPDGGLTGGRDVDRLAAHVDILPTLVDLCGLRGRPALPAFDGMSLAPLLAGKATADKGAGDGDRVLIESFRRVVLTQRWRLVEGRELYDIQKDPGQQRDVARQFPEVVARLTRELEEYRKTEDLRPHRVTVGSERQNPVTLTGEDWPAHPLIWQNWISAPTKHNPATQVWNVEVAQAGRYRIALRRWPRETGTPINGVPPKEQWSYGQTTAVALSAVAARLQVGDVEQTLPFSAATLAAEFAIDLQPGPTTLRAWFLDAAGQRWAAAYVDVARQGDRGPAVYQGKPLRQWLLTTAHGEETETPHAKHQ